MWVTLLVAGSLTTFSCQQKKATETATTDQAVATDNSSVATDNNSVASDNNMATTDNDREFASKVAKGGLMEVEAGRMAQQKGVSKGVKDFGAMMVKDHSGAGNELRMLATKKNWAVPSVLDDGQKTHLADMRKMSGKEFDKHYVSMMLDDHKKDVAEFEKAANMCKDADLKAFATKTLPIIKGHLARIEALQKTIN